MALTAEERARIQQRLQSSTQPSVPTAAPSGLPPEIEALIRSAPGSSGYLKSVGPRGGQIAPPRQAQQVQDEMRQKLLFEQAQGKLKALNAPGKPIPSGQLTALKSTNQAIRRLKKVMQTQQEKGYQTGPLSPRFYRGAAGNLAMQYRGTPDERAFKAEVERFTNDYITAQTGAQRGFKEMDWLKTAIPNASADIPENFQANAASALQDLEDNRTQMLQMLEETGYRVPKFTEDNTDRVKVVSPDGKTGSIPQDQVEAAQKKGFRLVQ